MVDIIMWASLALLVGVMVGFKLGLSLRGDGMDYHRGFRDGALWRETDDGGLMANHDVVDVVAAVRFHPEGLVWLCKRNSDGAHAGLEGMWEFPGGKVELDEQLRDALFRELSEEFPDVRSIVIGQVLDSVESIYQGKTYRVTFFAVAMNDPKETPCHSEVRWMTREEARSVPQLHSGTIFSARHLT